MPLPPRTIAADRGDAGRRLDLVLRRHLTDLAAATRTRVQGWIEDGRVSINGRVVRRTSTRAAFGDAITVEFPDLQPRAEVLPEDAPIECLFEDEHLLIVNKPAGLVSHPTYRHTSGTLMNALLGYARDWPEGQRPSLVGRLDKLTSGALLVAKSTRAHARLQRALLSSQSEKSYLAATYGCVPAERTDIALQLRRDPGDRRRVVATESGGLPSLTRVTGLGTVTAGAEHVSLVQCRLATGRMHQIRVHLSARGWPIVGDPKYGEARWAGVADEGIADVLRLFARQALHARRLAFTHPITGAPIDVQAPLPEDFATLLARLGLALPDDDRG